MKSLRWLFLLFWMVLAQNPVFALKISLNKFELHLEQSLGILTAQEIEKERGIVNDPKLVSRVQNIVTKLRPLVPRQDITYTVKILNDSDFNALALPGGYIYVNRGLLDHTVSDHELAYVLSHEFTHVSEKHGFKRVKTLLEFTLVDRLVLGGKLSESEVTQVAAVVISAKFSRDNEKEADLKGVELMVKAGYDPAGALTAMRRMETLQREQPDIIQKLFLTHPTPQDRSEYLKDLAVKNSYGQDFRKAQTGLLVKRSQNNPFTADLPIIVAHPSRWEDPLTIWRGIDGVGIFGPFSDEDKDIQFYLDVLRSGQFAAAVCDNDSHTTDLDEKFTFVAANSLDKEELISAIKEGNCYASANGVKIENENFRLGASYPKVRQALFQFKLIFPRRVDPDQKIIVYRDGEKLTEISPLVTGKQRTVKEVNYQLADSKVSVGAHWYVFYLPGQFITSPITLEVTRNSADQLGFPALSNWRKGLCHLHTKFSDGSHNLDSNWLEAKKEGVEFIFVTDHADCFGENVGWHHINPPGPYPHLHLDTNPYQEYVDRCQWLSGRDLPLIVPGVEYPLDSDAKYNHLLVLGLEQYLPFTPMSGQEFFGVAARGEILLESGPVHLGDDTPESQTMWMREFELSQADLANRKEAIVRLQVKAIPRKDPVISFNRAQVGQAVTEKDEWTTFEFRFDPKFLRPGKNLVDLETVIPDLWQTFDDCKFRQLTLILR